MTATASSYKIQSNIPLPTIRSSSRSYPFAGMAVGDSFALESNGAADVQRVRSAATHYGAYNQKKFAIRRVDPITKQYRCWRVA